MRRWLCRALAIPFFAGAGWWWLLSPGIDCNPRSFYFACSFFDTLGQAAHWFVVCAIAAPGAFLWVLGDRPARVASKMDSGP